MGAQIEENTQRTCLHIVCNGMFGEIDMFGVTETLPQRLWLLQLLVEKSVCELHTSDGYGTTTTTITTTTTTTTTTCTITTTATTTTETCPDFM